MDLGIEGRVAVITGGARGIGFAEAEALGAEGAVIAINDIDSVAAMDAAAILRARGIQASAFPADAADEAEVAEAMRKIAAKFGKIAILVNNAGIGGKPDYSAHEMPVEVWDSMQRVHVRSTFLWSRAAIPFMRLGGYGRIVNTSSMNYTGAAAREPRITLQPRRPSLASPACSLRRWGRMGSPLMPSRLATLPLN